MSGIKAKYVGLFFSFGLCFISAQRLAEKEAIIKGNIDYKQKKYEEAKNSYEMALLENKKSLKAQYNLGNSFYNQNKYKEAAKQYQEAGLLAKKKSDKSRIYHNLGNAFAKQNDYQNALVAYKNALKNNPLDDQTRYNFALAKKRIKKQEDNKPKEQKEKERKQKEKEEKQKEQDEKKKKGEQEKKDKNDDGGDEKNGQEKNKSKENNKQKPEIDSKLTEGILRAVERQEQNTHKRITNEQKNYEQKINPKDW
jgi:Ca-activated chloride channel homolog